MNRNGNVSCSMGSLLLLYCFNGVMHRGQHLRILVDTQIIDRNTQNKFRSCHAFVRGNVSHVENKLPSAQHPPTRGNCPWRS